MPKFEPLEVRFWKRVDFNGPVPSHRPELGNCWIWTGRVNRKRGGYGEVKLSRSRSNRRAHIVAFELTTGKRAENLVCHHCDNPPCVRPSHLFAGTDRDNTQDMMRKGRHRNSPMHGENHASHKLTLEQVRAARLRHASGHMIKDIAKDFGVTPGTISHIINGRSWNGIS